MAWYPIYRIPDASLQSQFLTFHSLVPTPLAATHFGAAEGLPDTAAEVEAVSNAAEHVVLPLVGIKWNNMHSEHWWDLASSGDSAPGPQGTDGARSTVRGAMPADLKQLVDTLQVLTL